MTKFNFTEKQIRGWGGDALYIEAEKQYYNKGDVTNVTYNNLVVEADIRHGGITLHTKFKISRSGNMIDSSDCPCAVNQQYHRICVHVIAASIFLLKQSVGRAHLAEKAVERKQAEALTQAESDGKLIIRSKHGESAEIRMRLPADWYRTFIAGEIPLACNAVYVGGGKPVALEYIAQRRLPLNLRDVDDNLVFALEDIQRDMTQPIKLTRPDFMQLLDFLAHNNRPFYVSGGNPIRVETTVLESELLVDLDRETGELLLILTTEIPGAPNVVPLYVVFSNKGYAFHNGVFWPLKYVLPGAYQKVYLETVAIPRKGTLSFLKKEINFFEQFMTVNREIDPEMFTMKPATPKFSLKVKGSPASLAMTLFAQYGDVMVSAGSPDPKGDFAIPDKDDFFQYSVRNLPAEREGIAKMRAMGIIIDSGTAITPLTGMREVLNFLGSTYPALEREGWGVHLEPEIGEFYSSLHKIYAAVDIEQTKGASSFEIGYSFKDVEQQGRRSTPLNQVDIQRTINRGDSYIQQGNQLYIFDARAIKKMTEALSDCNSVSGDRPGFVRISNVYAPYIKASIDAVEGASACIERSPDEWRNFADNQNRQNELQPVDLDEPLASTLRPYQKEGVSWFRFFEANKLGGILADEMGLGKTLQTLTWIQLSRVHEEYRGKPALVVCPTSLVDNWYHEAKKFVPNMKVLVMSGAQRHENFEDIQSQDLVITSYALLRRDILNYSDHEFSAIILDEAQNIKNRATQNATAVKQLRGGSHFVLTGTPMENSVADLWSIMDFLMPGYLNDYEEFRQNYEIPLSVPGDEIYESASIRLRRKLHPFLLRRKKTDVAKDLPPKIIQLSWCKLSAEQQKVYDQILEDSRKEIQSMVQKNGFEKSRMAILTALLRLRQVCCHLNLLGDVNPMPNAKEPSAKMSQFFDLFEEAISDGHRILVFSQFVKMLHEVRDALEARGIKYCYLDGSSKDRIESVHRFNSDETIPVFLISLKAGGTGLNLTGADTVIHLDPWWNPAVEDQATDRAHRIGQKKTVYSLKMITAGTVEEKVLQMQERKRAIIGATVESNEQTMAKLTWDDVKALFDM